MCLFYWIFFHSDRFFPFQQCQICMSRLFMGVCSSTVCSESTCRYCAKICTSISAGEIALFGNFQILMSGLVRRQINAYRIFFSVSVKLSENFLIKMHFNTRKILNYYVSLYHRFFYTKAFKNLSN